MGTLIQSAQVKYLIRLTLGQYQHEELEVSLGLGAEPDAQQVHDALRAAKDICLANAGQKKKAIAQGKPAQGQVARVKSVVAPSSGQPVQETIKRVAEKAAGNSKIVHKYAGYYYGYDMPYKDKVRHQSAIDSLKRDKQVRFDPDTKLWWSKVFVDGWEPYLVHNAMNTVPQPQREAEPAPQQEIDLGSNAIPDDEDPDSIPF